MENENKEQQEIVPTEEVEPEAVEPEETITGDNGLNPNLAGLLTYLAGFITGIIFLLIERENRFVRYHAWQSILVSICVAVVWVMIGIADFILAYIPILGWLIGLLLTAGFSLLTFIAWIVLMVFAYQGKETNIPVIGNYARNLTDKDDNVI